MSGEVDAGVLRRHFVAIATSDYDDPAYEPLAVGDEVRRMTDWLVDDTLAERRFATAMTQLATNPTYDQIRTAFVNAEQPWNERDAAVVFLTGHGETGDDTHWTVLKETTRAWHAGASLRTGELVGWLRRPGGVKHLMLIIDTCFAGKVATDLVRLDESLPETWLIIPSARKGDKARVLALSEAIGRAVAYLQGREGAKYGTNKRHFRVGDFLDTVREKLRDISPDQEVDPIYRGQYEAEHVCLPNPHYTQPDTVTTTAARHDLALPRQDLERHWRPRALGAGDSDASTTTGWLFTGRADLMRELIATARGAYDANSRVTLVTGGAGSGKSAVLARLVTLSDPDFLAAWPEEVAAIPVDLRPDPEHGIDIAVVASGKYAHDVIGQLSAAVGAEAPADGLLESRIQALAAAITAMPDPPTVVVDALDESPDPTGIARALATVASKTTLRLLVGVRSPNESSQQDATAGVGSDDRRDSLADTVERILSARRVRVDEDPWWDQDDLRAYAVSILRHTPGSPYAAPDQTGRAEELGTAIAQRIGRSFLVARLAAQNLTSRADIVDPADQTWLDTLADDVVGVFRDDLHQGFDDVEDRRRAVELLRAVAFSYGRGLPWAQIWPTVANAIADEHGKYGDRDIAWLLNSRLGGYLVTDVEDDVTVYRLFHQALRDTLRTDWQRLLGSERK